MLRAAHLPMRTRAIPRTLDPQRARHGVRAPVDATCSDCLTHATALWRPHAGGCDVEL